MIKNKLPGKFIVFEGLDGSGQSTQTELLKEYLKEKGEKVVKTKEPTPNSEAGKKIRKALDKKRKISPKKLQKLYADDREEHLNNFIIPNLKKGITVISDRYFFSSFAFGGINVDLDWLIGINDSFLLPDLTFFLNVPPEVCIKRIKERGDKRTLFEEKEKLKKVYQVFKKVIKRFPNVKNINGNQSINKVFKEVKKIYEQNN